MAHYFDQQTDVGHALQTHRFVLKNGLSLDVQTDRAVFSKDHFDCGSQLLVETVLSGPDFAAARTLVDLGCGYGPIGLFLKKADPQKELFLLDVNERALDLARANAKLNGLSRGLQVLASDGLAELPKSADLVVTNPPIRAGKATVFRFYAESFKKLTLNGALYVVIQKKQGALSTEKELKRIFGNCTLMARDRGYQIYRAVKESEEEAYVSC